MLKSTDTIICKVIHGSTLFGMNTSYSDLDIRGIFIPSLYDYLSLNEIQEHYTDETNDIVFYELGKFIRLALDCNPSIIELFFVPQDKVLESSRLWDMLVDNRDWFISKKARHTFTGYALLQLRRIKQHRSWLINPPKSKPVRSEYGLPERKSIPGDQLGAFNNMVIRHLEDVGLFHPLSEQLKKMEEYIKYVSIVNSTQFDSVDSRPFMEVSDNFIAMSNKEREYNNDLKKWNAYQQWLKNRNPHRAVLEREHGYDTKHAMHLFRLLQEGEEILRTGELIFPRENAKQLLEIRNGCWSYDEMISKVDDIHSMLSEYAERSSLPEEGNMKEANDFVQRARFECAVKGDGNENS